MAFQRKKGREDRGWSSKTTGGEEDGGRGSVEKGWGRRWGMGFWGRGVHMVIFWGLVPEGF